MIYCFRIRTGVTGVKDPLKFRRVILLSGVHLPDGLKMVSSVEIAVEERVMNVVITELSVNVVINNGLSSHIWIR